MMEANEIKDKAMKAGVEMLSHIQYESWFSLKVAARELMELAIEMLIIKDTEERAKKAQEALSNE